MWIKRLFNSGIGLKPVHEIEPVGKNWLSIGHDPHFNLDSISSVSGWFEFKLTLTHDLGYQSARLYFDHGDGFSEKTSVSLGVESEKLATRLIYLSSPPKRIRFDPITNEGLFSVDQISLEPCKKDPVGEAINRLLISHKKFQGLTSADAIELLTELSVKNEESFDETLHSYYDSTFITQAAPAASYFKWIEEVEDRQSLSIEYSVSRGFNWEPIVSILVPIYNPDSKLFTEMIDSVVEQSYVNWELCLVDDASSSESIAEIATQYASKHKNIQFLRRPENGHISRTSNDALAMATGDFVALLDHDDLLHPQALGHFISALNAHPDSKIFYSDEDKINDTGARYDPHFKSDWNPDLLYSQNYVSHLGFYSTQLVRDVGGFRVGYEGSQDHDLVLRCSEKVDASQITHIPHVLYHWRAIEGSTAFAAEEKSYTEDASIKALKDHFSRTRECVEVTAGILPNTYRCSWKIQEPKPLVSLLIPTRDGVEVLSQAVESILEKTTYDKYEIIILDNQSCKRETFDFFKEVEHDSRVRVLRYDYPFNFSGINNYGALFAKGTVYGLINNDIEVINPDWLDEMVSHVMRHDIGCVGAKLYYENGNIQHGGVIVGIGGVAGHSHKHFDRDAPGYFARLQLVQNFSAVTAAALLIRKEVFLEVGGLRESLSVAFNDVDFCLKVDQAGYRNLWTPYAELYHYESISRGTDEDGEKKIRFDREIQKMTETWGSRLNNDPYYNPHLTKIHENFEIHVP